MLARLHALGEAEAELAAHAAALARAEGELRARAAAAEQHRRRAGPRARGRSMRCFRRLGAACVRGSCPVQGRRRPQGCRAQPSGPVATACLSAPRRRARGGL